MKLSVFVPTFNRCDSLGTLLESLANQTYKNFEVIVVDGGSQDDTKKTIEEYSKKMSIVYFKQSQAGINNAGNEALEKATGDIFIRTDDDVKASNGWLSGVAKTFEDSKVGGGTGPTIITEEFQGSRDLFYYQDKLKSGNFLWRLLGKIYFDYFMEGEPFRVSHWFKSGAFSLGTNYKDCLKIKGLIEVDNLEACNWAGRKNLLEQIGGFDPTFVGLVEYHEPDAAFKIRNLGYKLVFNPKAIVYHCPSKDGFFKDRPEAYGRALNFINFYFRHIKPDTTDKFFRFIAYLLFLNLFWTYKFFTTGQINQLGSIPATFWGLFRNILMPVSE